MTLRRNLRMATVWNVAITNLGALRGEGRRHVTRNLQYSGLPIPRGVIRYVANIMIGFNSPESIRGGIMQQNQSGRSHNN